MENKEQQFLNIITKTLSDSSYIGDDCAYLKEFGLYITQDSLVEDVHFELSSTSAYCLGQKAVAVNLSDLAAIGAKPLYITISLSMKNDVDADFVKDFYLGVNDVCQKYGVKVVGGDLTGADKIFVSICAIGKKIFSYDISRSNAKVSDVIFVTGPHGDSAAGLKILLDKNKSSNYLVNKHLYPQPQIEKSEELIRLATEDFAMMDSSDGLCDALFKLAEASDVTLKVDFSSIPVSPELKNVFPENWKDIMLWGGEDFELVGCINEKDFEKLDKSHFFRIGKVIEKVANKPIIIDINNSEIDIDKNKFYENSFNHFKG